MPQAHRLKREERLSICKNVIDKGQVFANEIYPLYRESIYEKQFILSAYPDGSHAIFENNWSRRPVTKVSLAQDGICMFAYEHEGVEHTLYCGISTCDMAYRIERWFKEVFFNSRFDEAHPGAEKFRTWLKEIGANAQNFDMKMYFTPVLYPSLINKKETFNFLTEVKGMFIEEFDPLFNERQVNEVTDRASFK